jgi:hypothetical protein
MLSCGSGDGWHTGIVCGVYEMINSEIEYEGIAARKKAPDDNTVYPML